MRKIIILITIIIVAAMGLGSTYSYWEEPLGAHRVDEFPLGSIGVYNYDLPNGIEDYDDKASHTPGDIVKIGDDYVLVDKKCSADMISGVSCSLDEQQSAYDSPYKTLGIDWKFYNFYKTGEYTLSDNVLYKVHVEGSANKKNKQGPNVNGEGWKKVSSLIYDNKYYYGSGSIVIKDEKLYSLKRSLYHDEPWDDYAVIEHGEYTSSEEKEYQANDVVFYQSKVYQVKDVNLANQSHPEEIKGAWQRIDTMQWQENNIYDVNDVVMVGNLVYVAIQMDDNIIRKQPTAEANQWKALGEINYQNNIMYSKGTYVIHANQLYRAKIDNSTALPGSEGSEEVWEKMLI